MRLYTMYYMCKNYIDFIKDEKLLYKTSNKQQIPHVHDWKKLRIVLNELAQIDALKEKTLKLYKVVPRLYRDVDEFDVDKTMAKQYEQALAELQVSMETIIDLYESVNPHPVDHVQNGIDIQLPQFKNLNEFAACLKDLNFITTQCPYLLSKDETIKYGSVDVGSTWITLLIVGSVAGMLIHNFGKFVDQAIKIKSHYTTLKMQEEYLKSMQLKNEVAVGNVNLLNQFKEKIIQDGLDALESDIGPLNDGEERDKTKIALEKMAYWMDQGMKIYASIDSPKEVKDLFPEQQDVSFLTDNLMKLIEKKDN